VANSPNIFHNIGAILIAPIFHHSQQKHRVFAIPADKALCDPRILGLLH
jgi:hypothetical protein